jgi:hypothetical protein
MDQIQNESKIGAMDGIKIEKGKLKSLFLRLSRKNQEYEKLCY